MGDVLVKASLKKMFRERFLHTHLEYLNAISDILGQKYDEGWQKQRMFEALCQNMTESLLFGEKSTKKEIDKADEETKHFKNLRNAWYNECALNYPDNVELKMKFPIWKIVQCYHSVLSSVSAISRCLDNKKNPSIDRTFCIYTEKFLLDSKYNASTVYPINAVLDAEGEFVPKIYSENIK